jgi:hypothetical protein
MSCLSGSNVFIFSHVISKNYHVQDSKGRTKDTIINKFLTIDLNQKCEWQFAHLKALRLSK